MTVHRYNGELLYKAHSWYDYGQKWIWRVEPDVVAFIEESCYPYYTGCCGWVQDNKNIPKFEE